MLDKYNFAFMFAQKFHPSMKYAMPTRKELGFKTIFNNLGPLTNPANCKYIMIGVPDIDTGNKMSNALRILNKTALVVHGMEGLDEASIFGDTYVWEIRSDSSIGKIPDKLASLAASTASLKEYKIKKVVVILDRCEGGVESLKLHGIEVVSLFTIYDIV